MANYRQIHTQIWRDDWFFSLESKEKLLFMYLFANDSASLSGIYKLPLAIIAFETGLSPQFVERSLAKFEASEKVIYRDGIVWVVNMSKYHNYKSPKVDVRVSSDIEAIPEGAIKNSYLIKLGLIQYAEGMDTLPIVYRYHTLKEKENTNTNTNTNKSSKDDEIWNSYSGVFLELTGIKQNPTPLVVASLRRMVKQGVTVDDYSQAIKEMQEKGYTIATMKSPETWVLNNRKPKPKNNRVGGRGSRRVKPEMGDYVPDTSGVIVITEDD